MANYNNGYKYNNGINYNSADTVTLIRVSDGFAFSDKTSNFAVSHILREKAKIIDILTQYALFIMADAFTADERESYGATMHLEENLNIKQELAELLIDLYIKDKTESSDSFKQPSATLVQNENIKFNDDLSFEALLEILEKMDLNEISHAMNNILAYEQFRTVDREPRTADTDFKIGYDTTTDRTYKSLMPLGLFYDCERSEIPVMPPAEHTYIDIPHVDGSVIEDTVYKNRFFNLVLWSKDGLTTAQKEQLKCDLALFLDSMKKESKNLTIEETGITFDVKYSGNMSIAEAPSWIRASVPLESPPYGHPLFEQRIQGNGVLVNKGDTDMPLVNKILSGCVNPEFQIGEITYKWQGIVPMDTVLIIDHEQNTCYLERTSGSRTNVIDRLTGEFQKVPKGRSVNITAKADTAEFLITQAIEKILWKLHG